MKKYRNLKKLVLFLLLFTVLLLAITWSLKANPEGTTYLVRKVTIVQSVKAVGTVTPVRKTNIVSPFSGFVKKYFVKVGDRVEKGDPIVVLSPSANEAPLNLFPLRAPFSGTVVQIGRREGEFVENGLNQAGNMLARIDDQSTFEIEAMVPETEISKLRIGQKVAARIHASQSDLLTGYIESVSLAAKYLKEWDTKSRVEFPVIIGGIKPNSTLRSGMSAIIDVSTDKSENALCVPHEFIQKEEKKYFIVDEEGARKEVVVGIQNEELIEVLSGIKEGERIRNPDTLLPKQPL